MSELIMQSFYNKQHVLLSKGVLLLDLEANSFHAVVNRLIDEFSSNFDISDTLGSELLRTLLAPHKYVDGHTSLSRDINRSFRRSSSVRRSFKEVTGVSWKSNLRSLAEFED